MPKYSEKLAFCSLRICESGSPGLCLLNRNAEAITQVPDPSIHPAVRSGVEFSSGSFVLDRTLGRCRSYMRATWKSSRVPNADGLVRRLEAHAEDGLQ